MAAYEGLASGVQTEIQTDLTAIDCISGEHGGSYCELNSTIGPDDALVDNAVTSLRMLANYSKASGHPFWLGIGIHKPHIPWAIPTRFFRPLASIADTALPLHERPPVNMPPVAWNKGLGRHALDSYADADLYPLHAFENGSWVSFPHNLTRAMRRGYYAAVSYTDFLMGRMLDALDSTGLTNETVVAIMGDHGYNLGVSDTADRPIASVVAMPAELYTEELTGCRLYLNLSTSLFIVVAVPAVLTEHVGAAIVRIAKADSCSRSERAEYGWVGKGQEAKLARVGCD